VVQLTHDRRFGPPGVYVTGSADLLHWSTPERLIDLEAMKRGSGRAMGLSLSIVARSHLDRP